MYVGLKHGTYNFDRNGDDDGDYGVGGSGGYDAVGGDNDDDDDDEDGCVYYKFYRRIDRSK